MADLMQRLDVMEQQPKKQASNIEKLEKKYKRERSEKAWLALKQRIGEAKIKKRAQDFEASMKSMSVRINMLEREAAVVDGKQKTCHEDRRSNRAEFRQLNSSFGKLKRNFKAFRSPKSSTAQVDYEVAAVGKGKGKQISRIIKEQGKHYKLITQVRASDLSHFAREFR
jgi:hypothetical protein